MTFLLKSVTEFFVLIFMVLLIEILLILDIVMFLINIH
jgi:hypothetical protein